MYTLEIGIRQSVCTLRAGQPGKWPSITPGGRQRWRYLQVAIGGGETCSVAISGGETCSVAIGVGETCRMAIRGGETCRVAIGGGKTYRVAFGGGGYPGPAIGDVGTYRAVGEFPHVCYEFEQIFEN